MVETTLELTNEMEDRQFGAISLKLCDLTETALRCKILTKLHHLKCDLTENSRMRKIRNMEVEKENGKMRKIKVGKEGSAKFFLEGKIISHVPRRNGWKTTYNVQESKVEYIISEYNKLNEMRKVTLFISCCMYREVKVYDLILFSLTLIVV